MEGGGWCSPGAEQSQHPEFPGMPLISLTMARVSSSRLLSPPPCALLKATFSTSSLLLLRTDTQLRGQKASQEQGPVPPCSGCMEGRAAWLVLLLQGDPALPQSVQQPPHTKVLHGSPAANWAPGASNKLHVLLVASQPCPGRVRDTVRVARASNKSLQRAA